MGIGGLLRYARFSLKRRPLSVGMFVHICTLRVYRSSSLDPLISPHSSNATFLPPCES